MGHESRGDSGFHQYDGQDVMQLAQRMHSYSNAFIDPANPNLVHVAVLEAVRRYRKDALYGAPADASVARVPNPSLGRRFSRIPMRSKTLSASIGLRK